MHGTRETLRSSTSRDTLAGRIRLDDEDLEAYDRERFEELSEDNELVGGDYSDSGAVTRTVLDMAINSDHVMAAKDFWEFRRFIHREWLIEGWWTIEVSDILQDFYRDLIAGKRPKLLLQAPPQHGKSSLVVDFIAWISGKLPDLSTIYASFSDKLGLRANRTLQRIMTSARYKLVFPDTRLPEIGDRRYERTTEHLEFVGARGSFRNTTVNGQINGLGLGLGVIDDPMKGRAEARSQTIRDKVWDWLTDDFFSRFHASAGLLMIMTRWDIDDPAGRFIEHFPQTKVKAYPAIATKNEEHRRKGEALFPEWKPLDFLLERKRIYTRASWESLYQQSPIIEGGGMFPIEKFKIVQNFDRRDIVQSVRYWDKAGTEDGGAYTAGTLMHKMRDGTFIIEDVQRGQWASLVREQRIKQMAEIDNSTKNGILRLVDIWIEQEPGSGGKESAESTIRNLAGYTVKADKVSKGDGSKEVRAMPYAAQVQGGNIKLMAGEWNMPFLREHEHFPSGANKDQVDSAAGAFNKLTLESQYDSSMQWVGNWELTQGLMARAGIPTLGR